MARSLRRMLVTAVAATLALGLTPASGAVAASPAPPGKATATAAPVVALLVARGQVKVDCGPLPGGAPRFRLDYRAQGAPFGSSTTLPDGVTTGNLTLTVGTSYTVTCSYPTWFWWTASAPTTVRYPDLTLPVVRIDTAGGAPIVDRDNYVKTTVTVDPNGRAGVPALSTTGKMRGRGNSTWDAPTDKKPYKLKLDAAQPFLGMPAAESWGLLANFYDRTMMRSTIAYAWGDQTSLAWTPRTVFAEVILNGDYRGVYQASELVEVGPTRVDVDAMADTDTTGDALTGGYLAELDYKAEGPDAQPDDIVHFHAALSGAPFTIKDPDPVPAQVDYLKSQVDAAETQIAALSTSTRAYNKLKKVIDVRSYADWYVVSEMARNYDSWYSSTYMTKPRLGKLSMGPLWDFDLSMGTYFFGTQPSNDAWVKGRSPWYTNMLAHPAFLALVKSRYAALRPTIAATGAQITALDAQIGAARANDAVRWGYTTNLAGEVGTLRSWLASRQSFMDRTYG